MSEDEIWDAAIQDARENFEPVPIEEVHDVGKKVLQEGAREIGEHLSATKAGEVAKGMGDTFEEGARGWNSAVNNPNSAEWQKRNMLYEKPEVLPGQQQVDE